MRTSAAGRRASERASERDTLTAEGGTTRTQAAEAGSSTGVTTTEERGATDTAMVNDELPPPRNCGAVKLLGIRRPSGTCRHNDHTSKQSTVSQRRKPDPLQPNFGQTSTQGEPHREVPSRAVQSSDRVAAGRGVVQQGSVVDLDVVRAVAERGEEVH